MEGICIIQDVSSILINGSLYVIQVSFVVHIDPASQQQDVCRHSIGIILDDGADVASHNRRKASLYTNPQMFAIPPFFRIIQKV